MTVLDNLLSRNSALEEAREKHLRNFISKRPPDSITVREFVDHYNAKAVKQGYPAISQRTGECLLLDWFRKGEYQRALFFMASQDGRPRRTYVYWKTKR